MERLDSRRNSCTRRASSRALIWLLTVDWARYRRRPASVKLPHSTMVTKISNCFKVILLMVLSRFLCLVRLVSHKASPAAF